MCSGSTILRFLRHLQLLLRGGLISPCRIALRWYEKFGSAQVSADVYALGGEMIALDDEAYEFAVAEYVEETDVPFLSVAFRLASESRGHLQVSIHGR